MWMKRHLQELAMDRSGSYFNIIKGMLELELLYVTHCNIIPSARHINATSLNAFVSSLHTCSIFSGRISVGASHISQDVSDCIAISP
jgi:hypothetical protein